MCGPRGFGRGPGPWGCTCGCCGCGCWGLPRRFISREEEREGLEGYREQLRKELAGVEERLKELGGS
ncbi:MAG: hypothetical protein ACE5LX_00455 [Nitrospinota bacterium]